MSTILTDSAYIQAMASHHDGSTVPEIVEHRKRLDEIALTIKARAKQVEVLRAALTNLLAYADGIHCIQEMTDGNAIDYETFPEARAALEETKP